VVIVRPGTPGQPPARHAHLLIRPWSVLPRVCRPVRRKSPLPPSQHAVRQKCDVADRTATSRTATASGAVVSVTPVQLSHRSPSHHAPSFAFASKVRRHRPSKWKRVGVSCSAVPTSAAYPRPERCGEQRLDLGANERRSDHKQHPTRPALRQDIGRRSSFSASGLPTRAAVTPSSPRAVDSGSWASLVRLRRTNGHHVM
jgi:hypothetical protein